MTTPTQTPAARTRQAPVASPAVRWIVIIVGVLLLALAVVLGRELWLRYNDTNWPSWAKPFTEYIGNLSYEPWMLYAGIASCVVALILLYFVFKPRKQTHRPLADPNQLVWMRPVDLARMFSAQANKVPGVDHAETTVKRGGVHLNVTGSAADSSLSERVAQAVAPLAAQLGDATTVDITITGEDQS